MAFVLGIWVEEVAHFLAVVGLVGGDAERRSGCVEHLADDVAVVHLAGRTVRKILLKRSQRLRRQDRRLRAVVDALVPKRCQQIKDKGALPVIPSRRNAARKAYCPERFYRRRHKIENYFCR